MKYGRPIDCGDGAGIKRMTDVVTISDPLPEWAPDAASWLDTMFGNMATNSLGTGWKQTGQWFVPVPDGVQPGAFHNGADFSDPLSYTNPDGTYGDGSPKGA